jgi:hypothetical protein
VSAQASSAAFGDPERPAGRRSAREWLALAGVLVGALGFAASLTCVYMGMRDLMVHAGGVCASGGPYQVAAGHQCSSGQTGLLLGGVLAMVVLGGLYAAATNAGGGLGSTTDASALMWAALFGSLGFNFLSLGFQPPPGQSGGAGGIITGAVFELMALGGLYALISSVVEWVRRGGAPEPPSFTGPLVRAAVNVGGGPAPGSTSREPRIGGPPAAADPPPRAAPLPKRLNLPPREPRGR